MMWLAHSLGINTLVLHACFKKINYYIVADIRHLHNFDICSMETFHDYTQNSTYRNLKYLLHAVLIPLAML